jgi:hypothetical protein
VVARWNQHSQKKEEKCQLFGSTSSNDNQRNIALKSGKLSTRPWWMLLTFPRVIPFNTWNMVHEFHLVADIRIAQPTRASARTRTPTAGSQVEDRPFVSFAKRDGEMQCVTR